MEARREVMLRTRKRDGEEEGGGAKTIGEEDAQGNGIDARRSGSRLGA